MQYDGRYPLWEEISTRLSAPEIFHILRDHPFSFFLDSGMDSQNVGRYSFIGSEPFLVLKSRGSRITLQQAVGEQIRIGNPFDVLAELLETYRLDPAQYPVPFVGGVVGYFSYDLCHFIERLPSNAIDDLQLPECYLAFYDVVIAFDHLNQKAFVASTGFPQQKQQERIARAKERLASIKEKLQRAELGSSTITLPPKEARGIALRSNFTHQEYLRAVETVRQYIASGDVFQVNISQRFEAALPVASYELYRRLRQINPAPFAAFLNFDEVSVVSASPERFLKVQGDLVETRPIKGTRPRGHTDQEDQMLAAALQHSIKDRAENVMIVDLERNDLGKVCRFGTVRVRELVTLEKFPTVFHLTSTVEGRLLPNKTRIDLLKACFPGGSITGAPKVRSMEIIDELEPTRRSIYTGSLGYLDFSGGMDLNIAIRTILVKNKKVYFQVGGGIVYDSDPQAEYQETLDKAKALLESLSLSPDLIGAK